MNLHELRQWLRDRAEALTDGQITNIRALLERMSIAVQLLEEGRTSIKDGEARKLSKYVYKIAYVHRNARRTPFTLAHELGHVLLERDLGCKPTTKRDYWLHEKLCDDFAGYLIVPSAALASVVDRTSLIDAIDQLKERTGASWEVVGRRVAAAWPHVSVVVGKPHRNKADVRVFRVDCVAGKSLVGMSEKRHLLPETQLGALFLRMSDGKEWASLKRMLWPGVHVEAALRDGRTCAGFRWPEGR